MPGLDTGRLIREAQELMAASKEICDRSHRAIKESKRLEEIFTESRSTFDRARREHLLKH